MKEEGKVTEILPNALFRVDMDLGITLLAHISGRMRVNKIKVSIGDRVEVVVDPYGGNTTNRIVKRL